VTDCVETVTEYYIYLRSRVKRLYQLVHGFLKIQIWDILSTDTLTDSAQASRSGRTLRSFPSFYGEVREVRVIRVQKEGFANRLW